MSEVEHVRRWEQPVQQARPHPTPRGRLVRHTARELATLEAQTLVRMANVRANGMVAKEKLVEVDRVTREAMTGQAMLVNWAGALAADNALLYEELKFFVGVARMGKGQVIADMVDKFSREGR